jgi:hypothetical protein
MTVRQHTTDFAWWELRSGVPAALPIVVAGLAAGVPAAIGFSLPFVKGFGLGHGLGFVAAIAVGLLVRALVRRPAHGLVPGLVGGVIGGQLGTVVCLIVLGPGPEGSLIGDYLAAGLGYGLCIVPIGSFEAALLGALAGHLTNMFLTHLPAAHGIGGVWGPWTMLTNGVGFALAGAVAVALAGRRIPARETRWSPYGLACGLVIAVVIGWVTWLQAGAATGVLVGVVAVITGGYAGGLVFEVAPIDVRTATTPMVVLRRDRAAFWWGAFGPGLGIGLSTGLAFTFIRSPVDGQPDGWVHGLGVGLASFIGVGLAVGFMRACYGSFTLARWWLAATGALPPRLVGFLDDAHRRGVLRQSGAVYQFKHLELQRHLARMGSDPHSDQALAPPLVART